jgi:hypothetical protein
MLSDHLPEEPLQIFEPASTFQSSAPGSAEHKHLSGKAKISHSSQSLYISAMSI